MSDLFGNHIVGFPTKQPIYYMGLFQGTTIVKPVIYGNIARYFGKKREEDGHTHQWTVYIKPYKNEVI